MARNIEMQLTIMVWSQMSINRFGITIQIIKYFTKLKVFIYEDIDQILNDFVRE